MSSGGAGGLAPRSIGSFLEAPDETTISRLYGGIRFRAAIVNGVAQGRCCIGQAMSALPLRHESCNIPRDLDRGSGPSPEDL